MSEAAAFAANTLQLHVCTNKHNAHKHTHTYDTQGSMSEAAAFAASTAAEAPAAKQTKRQKKEEQVCCVVLCCCVECVY